MIWAVLGLGLLLVLTGVVVWFVHPEDPND